jgi:hypothetical protein
MLNKNFVLEKTTAKNLQISKAANPAGPHCPHHPTAPHWLPLGQPSTITNYRCSSCTPPPSKAMVARWHEQGAELLEPDHSTRPTPTPMAPTLVDSAIAGLGLGGGGDPHAYAHRPTPPYTLTIHTPAHPCPHSRSRIITEHYPSPLSSPHLRCWSCKRDITGLAPSTHDWGQSGAIGGDINLTSDPKVVV